MKCRDSQLKADAINQSYKLTKEQLNGGIVKCFENVRDLLNVSSILTASKSQYALGLYIVAVEEFGKALLLTDCISNDANSKWYRVPRNLFKGRTAHDKKINAAMDHLPVDCRDIFVTVIDLPCFGKKNNVLKNRTWQYRNASVPLHKGLRGNFIVPVRVGRDILEDTFYVDWDKKNNQWRFPITARAGHLYFRNYAKLFYTKYGFISRHGGGIRLGNRYASNPINGRLNYGYTVLAGEICKFVNGLGLDPYCGFFLVNSGKHAETKTISARILDKTHVEILDRCNTEGCIPCHVDFREQYALRSF